MRRCVAAVLALVATACAARTQLGPVDGHDLPAADLDRVAVGQEAPDFILLDHESQSVQLSSHRGKYVVLVFYRGHW